MSCLAEIYGGYVDFPENTREAIKWLTRAAEAGDARSQRRLGIHYHSGKGIEKDQCLGVLLYREAVKGEDNWAAYFLGLSYRDGEGVKRNRRLARHWFKVAAHMGVAEARKELRKISKQE